MEILNVGPFELLIVILLMFVLLGPKEMVLTARRIGLWIRSFVRSPMWKEIMNYSAEIRELPQKIMDDTGLKETLDEVRQSTQAAADDLKSTLKEVNDAARVQEAEHLRLGKGEPFDSNSIAPESVAVAAAAGTAVAGETAVAEETAEAEIDVVEPAADDLSAADDLPVAEEPPVSMDEAPAVLAVAEPAQEERAAGELPAAQEAPAAEEQPKRRRRKAAVESVEGEAPISVPAPAVPRKPRRSTKKAAPDASEGFDPTQETAQPAAEPAVLQVAEPAGEFTTPPNGTAESSLPAARTRRTRKPKVDAAAPLQPAAEPPAVVGTTLAETPAPMESAPGTGSPEDHAEERDAS